MALLPAIRALNIPLRKIALPNSYRLAFISTTKKSKETIPTTISYPQDLFPKKLPPPPKTVEDFAESKSPKNWLSYGYSTEDYEEDQHCRNFNNILIFTFFIWTAIFLFNYIPDIRQRDWLYREAYLELHRREKLGLPLVDKNYVDPATVELPSDEELEDTEIII